MENHEILTPSYEEACNILKHIIDVDFPTKENITHIFLQQEVLSYINIGANYSPEIKSALSVLLKEVGKKEKSTTKVVPKDNTHNKLLIDSKKNQNSSPKKVIVKKTAENILPLKKEIIIEPKIEKKIPIEEKEIPMQNIEKNEKVIINQEEKITLNLQQVDKLLGDLNNTNEKYEQDQIAQEIYGMIQNIYSNNDILLKQFRMHYVIKDNKANGRLIKIGLSPIRSDTAIKNIIADITKRLQK